jgi:hypothetical protein
MVMVSPSATDTTLPCRMFSALALATAKFRNISKNDKNIFIYEVCHDIYCFIEFTLC